MHCLSFSCDIANHTNVCLKPCVYGQGNMAIKKYTCRKKTHTCRKEHVLTVDSSSVFYQVTENLRGVPLAWVHTTEGRELS